MLFEHVYNPTVQMTIRHVLSNQIFLLYHVYRQYELLTQFATVVPTKSDSDAMFCLQSYEGIRIDRSLVY